MIPTLKDIERARIARQALINSDLDFKNIDYIKALRYLGITEGKKNLEKIWMMWIAPKRKVKRGSMIVVGWETSKRM